jgi:hypothetical protein
MTKYTNQTLPEAYARVAANFGGRFSGYEEVARVIASARKDIPGFYAGQDTLVKLGVKGIDSRSRVLLERILLIGEERAKAMTMEDGFHRGRTLKGTVTIGRLTEH